MRAAVFAASLLMICAARAAHAEEPPAEAGPSASDWLRVGLERYERGNLVGAIEAFERGYAIEPRPMFLFALGQAHRKRGDCARARASFDAFLATSPPAAQADAAIAQRERCVDATPEPATVAPAPPPAPAPAPPPPPPAPPARRWHDDRATLAAGGAGIVLLGGSAALWLSSQGAADDAVAATTYDAHRDHRERAEAHRLYAGVALGGAAVAAGVTIWRLARDRTEQATPPRAAIAPAIAPGTVGVTVGGRF